MAETLVQLLQESAQQFGSRTALLFKPGFRYQQWSYAQLWEGAGQVASLLQQKGLQKGDRALLWAPNCPQWVLAFFGCMRAGVIVVPLDLRSGADFVQRVAAKTRPKLAFVSRLTPASHHELEMPKLYLEELEQLCQSLPLPHEVVMADRDLAEIMFTSGTTGDPKGVMLTHANLLADLEAASHYIPGKPSYRLLSILPLSHMFEQMACLLMALRCGANITYPSSRQPSVLFRTMRERKITTMVLVPQALELFMNGIEREVRRQGRERMWHLTLKIARYAPLGLRRWLFRSVHQRFGGSLNFIVSGGAALEPELGTRWHLLGVRVIQGYGATEASPVISCHRLKKPRFDSAGLPLPGVEVRIAEDGEILVRGPNIVPGYWEAPEQTAATFQNGWYITGDLGFIDQQGFLHIRGRKKDMIAMPDGQKVYPDDIEAVLRRHPAVTDAVVVGLPKGSGVEVHAALLLQDQAAAPQVVSWANIQLEDRQQVRGFTVWPEEDFPRTHTLKVKKAAVLDTLTGVAPMASATLQTSVTQPVGAWQASPAHGVSTPRDLRRIVAEVSTLPLEQMTPDKTLGGDLNLDSLKRVELLSAVEEELGVYVDETQVGPGTTVHQLEEMVEQGSRTGDAKNFVRWGMSWWCRPLRGILQRAMLFPLVFLTYRLRVVGKENLSGIQGPVLFVANHSLHTDNGLIIKAIPWRWRRQLAIAAAADLWTRPFTGPFWGVVNPLLGNGFPFSREGAIRSSLDNLGAVLDRGWSVLIYPEGKMTIGGPMQPFKSGIGLVAVESRIQVIPLRLHIHYMGVPWQFPILRRGNIEVSFGRPLSYPPGTSYLEAAQAIEEAVKAL